MKKLFSYLPLDTDVAALVLRLLVGGLFMYHGWGKVAGYEQMVTQFPDVIGVGSKLSLQLVIFGEAVCGILVALGLLTRLAVIPIFITMAVAFFVAHGKDPFDAKTLPFLYMGLCLVIFILGPGRYSIDALINRNRRA